jgi:hypothetical protein
MAVRYQLVFGLLSMAGGYLDYGLDNVWRYFWLEF